MCSTAYGSKRVSDENMETFLTVIACWLAANGVQSLWLAWRQWRWEKINPRDAEGVLEKSAASTLGNGPIALLMIHGFADTPAVWLRIATRLAASGRFTCRLMRLPGTGQRTWPGGFPALEAWRDAIDAELAALAASHGTVWVVGHSMGGALTIDTAVRYPHRVAGIALLAPLVRVSRAHYPLLPPRIWFGIAQTAFAFSGKLESCFAPSERAADNPDFSYHRDRFLPFRLYLNMFRIVKENQQRKAVLTCPVYLAVSERDTTVDSDAACIWQQTFCTGPKAVRRLPEHTHVIPLEPGWQALADEIAAFIEA